MHSADTDKSLRITITPGTVVVAVLILLGFSLAWYLRELLLVLLTAVVLASAIEPMTARVVRWGVPRVLTVTLLYLLGAGVFILLSYVFVPRLTAEMVHLAERLPVYLTTLGLTQEDLMWHGTGLSVTDLFTQFQGILRTSSSSVLAVASAVFGGLMSFALIVVLSFYFAVQDRGLDDFLRLVTPVTHHDYVLGLWSRAQRKMGKWLQGQLLLSFIVGLLVYLGLAALGVPYALVLALAAGVLELVPLFGSIMAAVPAVVVAFIDAGASKALMVIALYVVVNQLEGNIVQPLVVQKILGVSPLVVILAIIIGAQLGGFLGIVIAVPIAAAVQEYVNDVQRHRLRERRTLKEEVASP